jgi:IS1 family transposase
MLNSLCEGMSMRSVSRLADTSINTVSKLLVDAGQFCAEWHDENVRAVKAKRVQCDEIWSFAYAKQKNVPTAKAAPEGAGDVWTWTGLDADSKLIVSWYVGKRDREGAYAFTDDLQMRLANRVQISTDGLRLYLNAIDGAFSGDVDYAIIDKIYGKAELTKGRYSPPECIGAKKRVLRGMPDIEHISTSYAERANLTMRMHNRRFTRLTNAFSKFENHAHMVAIYAVWYNWIRIHKSLRITPAMAAKLTDQLWSWDEIVAGMDAAAPKPGRRGPYKKSA